MAINKEIYLNECIIKRLVPFIEKNHSDNKYLFWPDLASSHYAKTVISFLEDKKINFVKKFDNPANLPEARPIENFWAILKGHVYKNNWKAENISQLVDRIRYCLMKIDPDLIQRLAASTKSLVDKIRRIGVIENN